MTAEEVREYLSEKIARYKIPELVEFMSVLPRNPTGKIMKHELKKMPFPHGGPLKQEDLR